MNIISYLNENRIHRKSNCKNYKFGKVEFFCEFETVSVHLLSSPLYSLFDNGRVVTSRWRGGHFRRLRSDLYQQNDQLRGHRHTYRWEAQRLDFERSRSLSLSLLIVTNYRSLFLPTHNEQIDMISFCSLPHPYVEKMTKKKISVILDCKDVRVIKFKFR